MNRSASAAEAPEPLLAIARWFAGKWLKSACRGPIIGVW